MGSYNAGLYFGCFCSVPGSVQCTVHLMEVQDGPLPALREGSIDKAEQVAHCAQ